MNACRVLTSESIAVPVTVGAAVAGDGSDAYVAAHPPASSYHRREWLDVIRTSFGHDRSIWLRPHRSGIVGVLPLVFFPEPIFGRFAVSMPFFNYGGVLADNAEAERALLDRAIEETRQAGGTHLELRHTRSALPRPDAQASQSRDGSAARANGGARSGTRSIGRSATRSAKRKRAVCRPCLAEWSSARIL